MLSGQSKTQYIHFTNSAALTLLPHTNFSFHGLSELLFKYRIAPFSGEIGVRSTQASYLDYGISFSILDARISNSRQQFYHTKKTYGNTTPSIHEFSEEDLKSILSELNRQNYPYRQKYLLAKLLRAKQVGKLPKISPDMTHKLTANCMKGASINQEIISRTYCIIKYHSLLKTMVLKEAKDFLQSLPTKFILWDDNAQTQHMEKIRKDYREKKLREESVEEKRDVFYMVRGILDNPQEHEIMNDNLLRREVISCRQELLDMLLSGYDATQDAVDCLHYIASSDNKFSFKEADKKLITEAFPLALLSDNPKYFHTLDHIPVSTFSCINDLKNHIKEEAEDDFNVFPCKLEVRCYTRLRIGVDITTVATDSIHINTVKRFFEENLPGANITVLDFNEVCPSLLGTVTSFFNDAKRDAYQTVNAHCCCNVS